jgi:hypothetical protein
MLLLLMGAAFLLAVGRRRRACSHGDGLRGRPKLGCARPLQRIGAMPRSGEEVSMNPKRTAMAALCAAAMCGAVQAAEITIYKQPQFGGAASR